MTSPFGMATVFASLGARRLVQPTPITVVIVALLAGLAGCADPAGSGQRADATSAPVASSSAQPTTVDAAACPESGVRVVPGEVDSATGFRGVGLTLTNCGTDVFEVNGYPVLELLDAEQEPLVVEQRRGDNSIPDPGPSPLVLEPGEQATSALGWRNTVTDGVPVEAQYVRIAAADGVPAQTSELYVDLGTTGVIELGAWAYPGPG